MTSIIKVDTLQKANGGTPTAADLGINTTGTVLQVQHNIFNGNAGASTTTYVSFGRYIDITPKYANSRIVITWSGTAYAHSNSNGYFTIFRTLSGGSATNMYNNGDYDTNSSQQALRQVGVPTSGSTGYFPSYISFIDTTHNSTGTIRYDLYGKRGSNEIYFPPGTSDAVDVIATEIAG